MSDFLNNQQTIEFIKVLENETGFPASADYQAIRVIKGGDPSKQGTWMHKLLAYKFAAWLSPEFELFVYKTFEEAIKEKYRLGSRYNPIKPGDDFDNRSYEANKDLFEANPGKFQDAVMHTDNRQDAEINYLKTELFELKFKFESLLNERSGYALKALPASTIGYYTIKEYRLKFKPNIPDTYSNSYIACLIKDHKLKQICGVVYGDKKDGVYTYKNLDVVFKWIVKMQKRLPAPMIVKRPGDADQLSLAM
jgi:hypothetical protein